ncbi:MAG: hypothetical protein DRJ43_00175 [Thermoprotei archaeon]|nr:MAG: hypothetical protein DRJ43_00175 [Thermoprotei archaeon]
MEATVTGVKRYDYARITCIQLKSDDVEVELELPIRILDEVGWMPVKGDRVDMEFKDSREDLTGWDIVLSGKLLRVEEEKATYSFGGLLCTLKGSQLEPSRHLYLYLGVKRKGGS